MLKRELEDFNMKTILTSGFALLSLSALAIAPAAPAMAQLGNRPGLNQGPGPKRPSPKNYFSSLKEITDGLSTKFNVKVVADPAIFVPVKPVVPKDSTNINVALDALTSQLKKVSWRRIYLTQNTGSILPPADKLAASIRAMELVEQSGIVLENTATRKASTLI